jgi:hypothetical protein
MPLLKLVHPQLVTNQSFIGDIVQLAIHPIQYEPLENHWKIVGDIPIHFHEIPWKTSLNHLSKLPNTSRILGKYFSIDMSVIFHTCSISS